MVDASVRMFPMESTIRDQEPGLYDVIHPLVVRWKLLCGGVILAILLGIVLSLLMAKQYETTILLNIGMSVDKQLEDPNSVMRIINSTSFQKTAAEKVQLPLSPRQLQKMIHAETDTVRSTPTIFVRVLADTPERTVALANAVADGIISRHRIFLMKN